MKPKIDARMVGLFKRIQSNVFPFCWNLYIWRQFPPLISGPFDGIVVRDFVPGVDMTPGAGSSPLLVIVCDQELLKGVCILGHMFSLKINNLSYGSC